MTPNAHNTGCEATSHARQRHHDLPRMSNLPRWSNSADNILNALSGSVYVTSHGGTLLAFGRRNWDDFACKNAGQDAVCDNLLGRNLFDFIQGDEVKAVYKASHATLIEDDLARISFEYRCDAPDRERRMLMSISTIVCEDGGETAILYQSQILEERMRVPMPLFAAGHDRRFQDAENQTSICSFCAKVAWPVGADSARQQWISADAYYARGGSSQVGVSHGICPPCFEKSRNRWRQ